MVPPPYKMLGSEAAGKTLSELRKKMEVYQDHWLGSFLLNVAVYSVLVVPGFLFIRYYKKSVRLQTSTGLLSNVLKCCILGNPIEKLVIMEEGKELAERSTPSPSSDRVAAGGVVWTGMKLCGCIAGLQVSYLTWGVMQESVITRSYEGEKFTNSQFLVFINRVLALLVSGLSLLLWKQPRHISPFYKYSYCSLSNIMSSWCQYEALKFVSFPTQILAKSCKVIPVMLMGKLVSNKNYPLNEYATALLMSVGVSMFLLATDPSSEKHTSQTTIAGLVILSGYMLFDSFTSNWQSQLFKDYRMSSLQMMFGINIFSCIFTIFSLFIRGTFISSVLFLINHPKFALHSIILSVCSASGQLFIFYTISNFGPLIFTLIMTSRQAVSILISCLVYGHVLSALAIAGMVIVFLAILLRVYFKQKYKK